MLNLETLSFPLVAALRLLNNTFYDNAGTDVGSDLIILQKHSGKKALSADEEFFIQSVVDCGTEVQDNKYFQAFPQNVICTDALRDILGRNNPHESDSL